MIRCLLILSLLICVGCGASGPPKYQVEGLVNFDGKPLPTGKLTLIPSESKAKTTVADIVDGKYSTEVTEGEWTVNIQAVRETGPVIEALREAPREQYLPRKYNSDSTLKMSVPVEGGKLDFDLEP